MQKSFFDGSIPFKIDKPIRLIELFGGYGSQSLSLKYLDVKFQHWKLVEWAVQSIQAYKDAHFTNDNNDYSSGLTKEELQNYLFNKGISSDYNTPLTLEQIKRFNETKLRQIYNNIKATNNLVNIMETKGADLKIVDTENYTYIMTYSFPCQDLSKAGKQKGMEKGSNTRSGMLWQVERLLEECDELPQMLLMENVPDVIGTKNAKHFADWIKKLEKFGYKNYWQNLNAKDYGIPQSRDRVFMVSLLGNYDYQFPNEIELKLRLKDLLEENVDEKYYLSDKMIKFCINNTAKQKLKGNGFKFSPIEIKEAKIAKTITTKSGSRIDDNFIKFKKLTKSLFTKNQTQMITKDGNIKRYINSNIVDKFKIGQIADISFPNGYNKANRVFNGYSPAINTTTTQSSFITKLDNYRIRKLTPKECFRLMGVKDEDYDNIAKNQSNSSLYHLAGDSIVVNVLMSIFKQIL